MVEERPRTCYNVTPYLGGGQVVETVGVVWPAITACSGIQCQLSTAIVVAQSARLCSRLLDANANGLDVARILFGGKIWTCLEQAASGTKKKCLAILSLPLEPIGGALLAKPLTKSDHRD